MQELARAYPETNAKLKGEVLPFWQAPRGPQRMLANAIVALQGIMVVLLLAVCGNTVTYARALATMEELRVGPALTLAANGGSLINRIRRLVAPPGIIR